MFNWISQLLKKNPGKTTIHPFSKTGSAVIDRYQCGRRQGNKLFFTAEDKRSIRSQVKQEINIDPFEVSQLPKNRVDVARLHNNEKLANNPVSQDHLLVNCPAGIIQLNNRQIQLHSDIIPSVGFMPIASSINQINHDVIVVVENLAIMQLYSQLILPDICQKALWIYRGDHKSGAKTDTCYQFISRFGQDKTVIVFSDMDPKGLEIALTMPQADYWLGPESNLWASCLASKFASRSGYDAQNSSVHYLLNRKESLSQPINELVLQIQVDQSSYRQEHMVAHHLSLVLFPLLK